METKAPPYGVRKNFDTTSENLDSGIYPYLHILKNRKGILVGCMFFTLAIAFVANLTQRPVYQATAELLLQPRDSRASGGGPAPNSALQDPTLMLTLFRLVQSPHLAEQVLLKLEQPENRTALLDCFGIHPSRKRKDNNVFSDKERRAILSGIQRSLSARQPDRGVRLIHISAVGYNPPMVMRLANVGAETFIETNYRSNMDSFRQSFLMISKSLAEIREKIKTGEIAFQKIDSEIRLLEALKIYEEKHPLVIQLRSDIPELAQKLKREIQNLETMQIGQRKDLATLLLVPSVELEELSKIETDLYTLRPILEQEVNTNKEMYSSIFRRLQEVEVSGGGSVWMDSKVAEQAGIPGRPIRPNKKLNLIIGFFVGLFMGSGLAFFREYLDSSIRSMEDVRNYLKLFPLGMIPYVDLSVNSDTTNGEKTEVEKLEGGILPESTRAFWLAGDIDIPLYVAEAYRIVRTNLAFGSIDTTLKVLQVTSAVKGEGKTTTAANLGISLALAGSRVLLVDADMRRPSLHRILGLEGIETGLSEALTNGKSWQSLTVPTSTPNLSFLGVGAIPPNPAELLSSKRMKALVEELKEHFDTIIFDSPPVISVADSAIIASRVEGTIFVSRSGFVPRHLCLQAKSALESVNGKIIGCILNSAQTQHQPYYFHEYHRQYGKYEEHKPQKDNFAGEGVLMWEKLRALKEPLLLFVSSSWSRIGGFIKGEQRPKKESNSSVGTPQ